MDIAGLTDMARKESITKEAIFQAAFWAAKGGRDRAGHSQKAGGLGELLDPADFPRL